MVISWILFVSTGMLLPRYYKYFLPNVNKFCGADLWFLLHRLIMIFATICTIAAFCIIVAALEKWVSSDDTIEFTHSIFGIFTIIFSIIQVLSFCRIPLNK